MFLIVGYVCIRTRRIAWHRRSMLTAAVFAALFLVVYVTRYVLLGSKIYPGEGVSRIIYFAILIPHIIIAIAVAPLAFVTLRRALGGRFAKHRQIARITLPLWIYTAVSGWVVYWMLYHFSLSRRRRGRPARGRCAPPGAPRCCMKATNSSSRMMANRTSPGTHMIRPASCWSTSGVDAVELGGGDVVRVQRRRATG